MTDRELKRIGRAELLELLLLQSEENEWLQMRVDELEQELRDRDIIIEDAGTIAEAAFEINRVFDAAGSAAVQYLENIKRLNHQMEQRAREMGVEVGNIDGFPKKQEHQDGNVGAEHSLGSGRAADNVIRGYSLADLEYLLAQEKGEVG